MFSQTVLPARSDSVSWKPLAGNDGADVFAEKDASNVSVARQLEHANWHLILAAKRYGSGVHHANFLLDKLVVSHRRDHDCVCVFDWIARVNPVDLGGLEQGVRLNFHCAKGGRGIGRKVRIAGSCCKHEHAAALEVPYGTPADIGFGNLTNLDGAHHPRRDAGFFECVLKRERIDDRGEHAHGITLRAVHSDARTPQAAKNVTTADDDANLSAERVNLGELFGGGFQRFGVNSELVCAAQGLAAELQHHLAELQAGIHHSRRGRVAHQFATVTWLEPVEQRRKRSMMRVPVLCLAVALGGCTNSKPTVSSLDAGLRVGQLSPEQAATVLVDIGDEKITLGEYAAAIEHMDQFDRLRYQAPERRHELLEEMINVRLLAREARRRGLDKDPLTQAEVRQILRDAALKSVRDGAMAPDQIPESEVHAYFDAHQADFQDPERRRLSLLVLRDEASARETLIAAQKTTAAAQWGELVRTKSLDPQARSNIPLDLLGDVGFVSPPGDPKGSNPKVPERVRAAAFLTDVGRVHEKVIAEGGKHAPMRKPSGRFASSLRRKNFLRRKPRSFRT